MLEVVLVGEGMSWALPISEEAIPETLVAVYASLLEGEHQDPVPPRVLKLLGITEARGIVWAVLSSQYVKHGEASTDVRVTRLSQTSIRAVTHSFTHAKWEGGGEARNGRLAILLDQEVDGEGDELHLPMNRDRDFGGDRKLITNNVHAVVRALVMSP